MRSLTIAIALAVPLPLAAAQDPKPAPEPGAEQAFKQLNEEFQQARQAFFKKYMELAETDRKAAEALMKDEDQKPEKTFQPKFLEAGRRYGADDGAVPFLATAVQLHVDRGLALEALDLLLEEHTGSAKVEELAGSLHWSTAELGADIVQSALDTFVDESPHPAVQAAACFSKAKIALEGDDTDTGLALMRRALELSSDFRYAAEATGAINEHERLQVGMEAPDIVGADIDGVEFKLSDYRGKVVVLDFWGDW